LIWLIEKTLPDKPVSGFMEFRVPDQQMKHQLKQNCLHIGDVAI